MSWWQLMEPNKESDFHWYFLCGHVEDTLLCIGLWDNCIITTLVGIMILIFLGLTTNSLVDARWIILRLNESWGFEAQSYMGNSCLVHSPASLSSHMSRVQSGIITWDLRVTHQSSCLTKQISKQTSIINLCTVAVNTHRDQEQSYSTKPLGNFRMILVVFDWGFRNLGIGENALSCRFSPFPLMCVVEILIVGVAFHINTFSDRWKFIRFKTGKQDVSG